MLSFRSFCQLSQSQFEKTKRILCSPLFLPSFHFVRGGGWSDRSALFHGHKSFFCYFNTFKKIYLFFLIYRSAKIFNLFAYTFIVKKKSRLTNLRLWNYIRPYFWNSNFIYTTLVHTDHQTGLSFSAANQLAWSTAHCRSSRNNSFLKENRPRWTMATRIWPVMKLVFLFQLSRFPILLLL